MSVGIPPVSGGGPALQDSNWLNGLAGGLNRSSVTGLTATAGGTKAAAYQIAAQVAMAKFDTVATNGDSALLPQAKKGTVVMVHNNGAATLSLYGKGTDTINAVATATAYDLTTTQAAIFFCCEDGEWSAVKTAA